MAGSYPDVPGPRIIYDRDGTTVAVHDGSASPTVLTTAQLQKMNDESMSGDYALPAGMTYVAFIFPVLRDLAGYGARFGDAGTYTLQYSTNTTTGLDGTWTNLATGVSNTYFDPTGVGQRTTWTAITQSGIKAVRFQVAGLATDRHVYGVHLYGAVSTGQVLDRLGLTDMVDNPIGGAYFDWGDVPRGSSADKQFKVKNLSTTKTAQNVVLSFDTLTDATPSVPAQHLLSLDGSTFSASVTITSIAPGASVPVTMRRVTPSNAALALWDLRLVAIPGVFS